MMKNQSEESNQSLKFTSYGMAIGLVFGGLVGLLIGIPMVFAGGGMVLGFAIGTSLDQRRNE